jgi:fatty-acid desaturase
LFFEAAHRGWWRLIMTLTKRVGNFLAILIGFASFVAAGYFIWIRQLTSRDLLIIVVMYVPMAMGITVGYHRMLTHRAFETYKPIKYRVGYRSPQASRLRRSPGRST